MNLPKNLSFSLASSVLYLLSNLVSSLEPLAQPKSHLLLVIANSCLGDLELYVSSHYT